MELLERAFEKIGARVKFEEPRPIWANGRHIVQNLALDVRTDAKGEFFFIARNREAVEELIALDAQPQEREQITQVWNAVRASALSSSQDIRLLSVIE
jgi:hypothetical protein